MAGTKTDKPYLIRVDILVPEASLCGTRHELNLAVDKVDSLAVFLLAREVIKLKKSLSGIDIVDIKF